MAKEEWGTKRVCQATGCGARFYDLRREPVICPKCDTQFIVQAFDGFQVEHAVVAHKKASVAKEVPEAATDDEEILEDDVDEVDAGDEVLDESDDDTISLEEIANVTADDET